MARITLTRWVLWQSLMLIVSGSAAGAEFPPAVSVRLQSDTVFSGEMPVLQIEATAPRDNAVKIVKPERAHFGNYCVIDLIGPTGRVPGGAPHELRVRQPDDFNRVEPGNVMNLSIPLLFRPPHAGEFTVHAVLCLTPDSHVKYDVELKLTARDLPKEDILEAISVTPPAGANLGNDRSTIEILRVKTGEKRHQLFYRRNNRGTTTLNRMVTVEPDAKISVQAIDVDGPRVAGKIQIKIWNRNNQRSVEVDYFGGELIENRDRA